MTSKSALIKALIMAVSFGSISNSFAKEDAMASLWLQSKVQGTISDENGIIAGASITIKGDINLFR